MKLIFRTGLILGAVIGTAGITQAHAASFCDLLPAQTVAATLGLKAVFTAVPDISGGNGCDYAESAPGPTTVETDASDASGMFGSMYNTELGNLGPDDQKTSIAGKPAIYSYDDGQQFPNFPNASYTKQSLQFLAKGKYVSISVTTPGEGLPEAAILAFGTLAAAQPIDTLKDPSS